MQRKKKIYLKSVIIVSFVLIILIAVSAMMLNSAENINFNFLTGLAVGISTDEVAVGNLSKVFNQDALQYDKEYAKQYLDWHGNFSQLNFKKISSDNEDFIFSIGNKINDLNGVKINENNFAIHLVYCDEFEKFCKFRINGIPTTRMYIPAVMDYEKINTFDIDGEYQLKINSVKFNHCDNHRFCNLGYEGYHLVNVSVERKT